MKKFDSLVCLIRSLSKSEKKHFAVAMTRNGTARQDYAALYRLIVRTDKPDESGIRNAYAKEGGGSFDISVHYLYDRILDSLVTLRRKKDIVYDLFQQLSKVRVLYERAMYHESFSLLDETIRTAHRQEIYEVLFYAMKLQREHLLGLNFPNIKEKELYHIHYRSKEILRNIQKIDEQGALYELLKYRLLYRGHIRSAKQKQDLNDLVISEIRITSSFSSSEFADTFEIVKNHKLFQACYLTGIGDSASALRTFRELVQLFGDNLRFWSNPPIYYLSVLEGILNVLRASGNYAEMGYFREKLSALADGGFSQEFRANARCLLFLSELFPLFDRGDYEGCQELENRFRSEFPEDESWLNPQRRSELLFYTSLIRFGLGEFAKAKQCINAVLFDRDIEYLPIMKTIRLVRLMLYYELKSFDLLQYEIRSIRRSLALKKELSFRTERLMLWFLGNENLTLSPAARTKTRDRIAVQIASLHNDRYEMQLLSLFDFTAWIDSKLTRRPLHEIIRMRFEGAGE